MATSVLHDVSSLVQAHECRFDVALLCSPLELHAKPWLVRDRSVILIDTLRNSTSITVALAAGSVDIILYGKDRDSLSRLRADADSYTGNKLLAGESEGSAIAGFDCGNSPLEFTTDRVAGRRVFYSSTNGGAAFNKLLDLAEADIFWACILNARAVGAAIARKGIELPIVFLCAGFRGTFAFEDFVTAGQVLIAAQSMGANLGLCDDGASAAMEIASARFDAEGRARDPDLLCRELENLRCGSVLSLMAQAEDIQAAVAGTGIHPTVLVRCKNCVPFLDQSSDPPRIVSS